MKVDGKTHLTGQKKLGVAPITYRTGNIEKKNISEVKQCAKWQGLMVLRHSNLQIVAHLKNFLKYTNWIFKKMTNSWFEPIIQMFHSFNNW